MIDRPITGSYQLIHVTPENLTVPALRAVLRKLVDRHEALRSVYPMAEHGTPIQAVRPTSEPELAIEDLGAVLPEERLARLAEHLPASFDLLTQTPLRVIVGVVGGLVCDVGLVVHNVAVDGAGKLLLQADFEELIAAETTGRPPRLAAATTWQPVDQARAEAVERGQKDNDAALEYWRSVLAAAPHATLPFYWSGAGPEVSGHETTMVSKRLTDSCLAALRKYHGSPPTMVMALFAIVLVSWTGHRRCLIRSTTSNRWTDGPEKGVGHYATDVGILLSLDGEVRFSEVVRRTWKAALDAYSNSAYDNGELAMTEARRSVEAGARLAYSVLFDYYDYAAGESGATELPEDPRLFQYPDSSPILALDVIPHAADAATLRLRAPASLLPAEAAQQFLGQLLELAERVAAEDDPWLSDLAKTVELPAPWHGPGWISRRDSWISVNDIADLLKEHDDVADATVAPSAVADGEEPTLVAYVAPRHPGLTPAELHEHMRDRVSHFPTTALPDQYVICGSRPADSADLATWRAQPAVASGPGRVDSPTAPQGRRERVLADAFAALHPEADVSMSATYAELHGQFLRIPAMLDHIGRAGYRGLAFGDLMGMATLRQLASRLEQQQPRDQEPA